MEFAVDNPFCCFVRSDRIEHMFEDVTAVTDLEPAVLAELVFGLSDEAIAALGLAEAEALVAATQRVVNAVAARQASAVETVARRCDERCEQEAADLAARGGRPFHTTGDQVAAASLAALLHVAPRTMSSRVARARRLVCALPDLQRLAWAGDLEPYRVDAVVHESGAVDPARLGEFEARLLEADVSALPTSLLRRRARACAVRCAPDDAAVLADRARARRGVRVQPGDLPGMTRLVADLPTATAWRLWGAIDGLAAEYVRASPGTLVGAARAEALSDLIEAHATIATTVELVAPIDCEVRAGRRPRLGSRCATRARAAVDDPARDAQGDCEELGDGILHQHGDLSWFVSGATHVPTMGSLLPADIVALLADPDVTVRLARTDQLTGAVRWQDPTAYRPTARTSRAVRSRDGTCRFPGCGTPARRCQLDHVVRFPEGRTQVSNLQSLCATHHGFKHHAGWTVEMDTVGVCTWTAPDGRTHVTWPLDRHDRHAA
jgi:hypothetical protein